MNYEIIPIKTPILTHHDNIIDAIIKYGSGQITQNDVICVAESVVSITQGTALRCDDIHPKFLAKCLSRLFPAKGSIASPYSMQMLINFSGGLRVFAAVILGTLAKCIGIAGVFYRTAGYQARLIDDVTGTMPPFDKHIVPGPNNPVEVSETIKTATGAFGACIADVNDLKRSHILGTSKGVNANLVAKILIDNPFGNDSQKTPICIIKNYVR
ncbi:MAG: coenzyme F420-0:L-glutamate ligase [Phascolarctobacterium sp.]|nr:coenzyme F420-0:L-glutamate ligase [Candidatus Phascolarctobacterium caballi]